MLIMELFSPKIDDDILKNMTFVSISVTNSLSGVQDKTPNPALKNHFKINGCHCSKNHRSVKYL